MGSRDWFMKDIELDLWSEEEKNKEEDENKENEKWFIKHKHWKVSFSGLFRILMKYFLDKSPRIRKEDFARTNKIVPKIVPKGNPLVLNKVHNFYCDILTPLFKSIFRKNLQNLQIPKSQKTKKKS